MSQIKPRQIAQAGAADGQALVWDAALEEWVPGDAGDPTAIPSTTVDAKGDLLVASADNTVTRLAVGTDGYALVADSTQPLGVTWAEVAAGGGGGAGAAFSGCRATPGGTSTVVPHATFTPIKWAAESYDTDGYHDTATNNSRIVIPEDGYYEFVGALDWGTFTATNALHMAITPNGLTGITDRLASLTINPEGASRIQRYQLTTGPVYLTAGTYVELQAYHSQGADVTVSGGSNSGFSFLTCKRVDLGGGGSLSPARFTRTTKASSQSCAHNTQTFITWDAAPEDTALMWDPATPTRLTASEAGTYLLLGSGSFPANGTGHRALGLYVNGAIVAYQAFATNSGTSVQGQVLKTVTLAAGDYVELMAVQSSGGPLNYEHYEDVAFLHAILLTEGGGGASTAADVSYDPATSGLAATDVQAAIDEVANAGGDAWTAISSFLNSWGDYSTLTGTTAYATAAYRKENGRVWLRGLIRGGTVPTTTGAISVFTLPAGFRPARARIFTAAIERGPSGGGEDTTCRLDVNADGTVYIQRHNGSNPGNGYLSLDGICFDLA